METKLTKNKIEEIARSETRKNIIAEYQGYKTVDLDNMEVECKMLRPGLFNLSIKVPAYNGEDIHSCRSLLWRHIQINGELSEDIVATIVNQKINGFNKKTKEWFKAVGIARKFFVFGEPNRELTEKDFETIKDVVELSVANTLDDYAYDLSNLDNINVDWDLVEENEIRVIGEVSGDERRFYIDMDFDADLRSFERELVDLVIYMLWDKEEIDKEYKEREEE